MTLLWRAAESGRSDRFFADRVAEDAAALLPPWPPSAASQAFADLVALRTLAIDTQVATALAAGLEQIVVFGAGLDTRFWRVPVPAGARVIEIDSAAVNDFARQLLPAGGVGRRLEARIPSGVLEALARAEYDHSRPTLWIAEGLVEYLPGHAWDRLVHIVTTNSAPESRAIVSVLGETLPSRFAHDPTFPFPRLPPLSRILAPLSGGWHVEVVVSQPLRNVPPDAFAIIAMRRLGPPSR